MNSRGLSPHSSTDLDRLINLIKDDLLAFTQIPKYAGVPAQWRPASFAIIPQPFEENDGLVNSTLKLVRHNIREFYRFRLDEIYSVQVPDPLLEGNRNALKAILES